LAEGRVKAWDQDGCKQQRQDARATQLPQYIAHSTPQENGIVEPTTAMGANYRSFFAYLRFFLTVYDRSEQLHERNNNSSPPL
jgi:hypothetical protein